MNLLLWIVLGALAGWVASIIMRTNNSQGLLMDIVIGILGAVLGGWIMSFFGETGVSGFNLYSFLVALLGSVALLAIFRGVRRLA
ncbi:MAG TPA: GlsB/YeaQ/YmgE family stress response membrane protein [Candidatus Paceibacterota bacterium]|nr:GlsB/YeaQ/YmgE family stress response membrane protein [Candidatus Paceibacterota bacterium]